MARKLSLPAALAFVVLGVSASSCGDSKPSPNECFCFAIDVDAGRSKVNDGGSLVVEACTGPNDPKQTDPEWQCEVG